MKYLLHALVLWMVWSATPLAAQQFELSERSGVSGGWAFCWADYDRDGDLDLVTGRLYRNRGDGTFEDVTSAAGITSLGRARAWADYDNDGWLDLYVVVQYGPNRLYRNTGCGKFVEVAEQAGLTGDAHATFNCAWTDYDGDGHPDLYVTGGAGGRLYRNRGDGTFVDRTLEAGVTTRHSALAAIWGDYDNDGKPDLFVNHVFGSGNRLFRNEGVGLFTEVASLAGVAAHHYPYGAGWADYNRDGLLDLFCAMDGVGHNRLWQNLGGTFVDRSVASGVRLPGRRSRGGVSWGDYDNDGWIDLLIGDSGLGDQLLRNRGDGTFEDRTSAAGLRPGKSSSVAFADFDGDGKLDIASGHGLYVNRTPGAGAWLAVRLIGNRSSKDALGARIVATSGTTRLIREITSSSTYAGQDGIPGLVHIGLGALTRLDRLEVRWPSGLRTTRIDLPLNRRMTIIETGTGNTRAGRAVRVDLSPRVAIVFERVTSPGTTTLSLRNHGASSPAGYTFQPLDPSQPQQRLIEIRTTASVSGRVTLLVAQTVQTATGAVSWDAAGAPYTLATAAGCPAPGWQAWEGRGPGLFALVRPTGRAGGASAAARGNNGLGNGVDPAPPGAPPVNDGPGTGPGSPGNRKRGGR